MSFKKMVKGTRPPPGERAPSAKLTDQQVAELRRHWEAGAKQATLAREFHVSPALVCMIVNGQRRKEPSC